MKFSQILTCCTRNVFSTIRQSNQFRQKKRDINSQISKNVKFIDIFESLWLRNSNCIDFFIVVLKKYLDKKNNKWNNWTIFYFKISALTNTFDVEIKQSSNYAFLLKCVKERSVSKNYWSFYQHNIEWTKIKRFFEKLSDKLAQTVFQFNIESIIVELLKAIYSQQKNKNMQQQ